mgnify:CR=1 FL=1
MTKSKLKTAPYVNEYFSGIQDEVLVEMAFQFPSEFKKMCILMCLDFQLEKESYEKENSRNRGNVC